MVGQAFQGQPVVFEHRIVRPDKGVRVIQQRVDYVLGHSGRPMGLLVGTVRDITERKQVEQALRTNEERFRRVTKAAGRAIWDWDVASGRQWWSEGLQDIFGHEGDPSGSAPTIWRTHIHPDDVERMRPHPAGRPPGGSHPHAT